MVASVVWIGGLAALAVFVLPAARWALTEETYTLLLVDLQRRLDPLGWFCLAVLAGSGLIQMSANPNYRGFLIIEGYWGMAILLKHLVFLGMAAVSAYMSWGLLPKLRRIALLQARGVIAEEGGKIHAARAAPEAGSLQRQETSLLRINLLLGILVLGLTAIARAV
jgi:uncharacterized membrane protein